MKNKSQPIAMITSLFHKENIIVSDINAIGSFVYVAHAQVQKLTKPITEKGQIWGKLESITSWFAGFVITLSVILIIYAAFLYVTAAGSSEKVEKAHQVIIYAVVGIVVALLAWGVPNLVGSFLG